MRDRQRDECNKSGCARVIERGEGPPVPFDDTARAEEAKAVVTMFYELERLAPPIFR